MYKQDKIGVDVRIDAMQGELSHDIKSAKQVVEVLKKEYEKEYEEAHEAAVKAMNVSIDAKWEFDKAKRTLEELERIDEALRQAREDVDKAFHDWMNLRTS